VDSLV
jgi:hypothetical protein